MKTTKKLLSIFLTLAMLVSLVTAVPMIASASTPPPPVQEALAGDSHGSNGRFLTPIAPPVADSRPISSAEELLKIGAEGGYHVNEDFHLTADIDLSGIDWVPIMGHNAANPNNPLLFTGTFDGQGFAIRNMTITGEFGHGTGRGDDVGLFGTVGGTYYVGMVGPFLRTPVFKNLGLEDVNINVTGARSVGGLFGSNTRGSVTISNCYVTGNITTANHSLFVGGLVGYSGGYNPAGILNISDSYNAAAVTADAGTFFLNDPELGLGTIYVRGRASAGGIIGVTIDTKTITNCHNVGEIRAESTGMARAGGIAASLWSEIAISNCSNAGNISAISSLPADKTTDSDLNDPFIARASAGGIVAFNPRSDTMSTITGCINTGNITAEFSTIHMNAEIFAGGIGGNLHEQTLSDCYNTGTITARNSNGTNGYAGGIVARNSARSSIRRSYSTGTVSAHVPGGIAGLAVSGGNIRNNYFLSGSAARGIGEGSGGTTALTLAQMRQEASFPALNLNRTWAFSSGVNDGMPILRFFHPDVIFIPTMSTPGPSEVFLAPIEPPLATSHPIGTVEDLMNIGADGGTPLHWDYHLTANLDLMGIDWVPIGDSTNRFSGTFDGQGYAIHNLEISGLYRSAGLFGEVGGTNNPEVEIKNLALEDVYINVNSPSFEVYAGGIVGMSSSALLTIHNSYVTGSVTAVGGPARAGGLVGNSTRADFGTQLTMTDSFNLASVNAMGPGDSIAGGLVGHGMGARIIRNLHNYGKIDAEGTGTVYAGGIAGGLHSGQHDNIITRCSNQGNVSAFTSSSSTTSGSASSGGVFGIQITGFGRLLNVSDCFNTGDISAVLDPAVSSHVRSNVGGIAGWTQEIALSDCYNTGNITAMNSNNANGSAGGIIGVLMDGSSVRRSYSTGDITAAPDTGGIVGHAEYGSFISNCYWNSSAVHIRNTEEIAQASKRGVGAGSGTDTTTALTDAQMRQESSYNRGLSFRYTYAFSSGINGGFPVLRAFHPGINYTPVVPPPTPTPNFAVNPSATPPVAGSIPIATREQLDNIRNDLDGNYHLTANIDLSGTDWEPIIDFTQYGSEIPFTGVFDGQGYTITGMEII
ncbi:MAG: hypothetical protein LBC86_00735, partial [Oscillospiraceae bacterium]|nr:hypothetical protein [Oscillospiraceae bacterium]